MSKRYKFKDLVDIYPGKHVVIVNEDWENGRIDTCEVYGVYDTEKEALEASKHLKSCGIFMMIREEDELGFIFVVADNI